MPTNNNQRRRRRRLSERAIESDREERKEEGACGVQCIWNVRASRGRICDFREQRGEEVAFVGWRGFFIYLYLFLCFGFWEIQEGKKKVERDPVKLAYVHTCARAMATLLCVFTFAPHAFLRDVSFDISLPPPAMFFPHAARVAIHFYFLFTTLNCIFYSKISILDNNSMNVKCLSLGMEDNAQWNKACSLIICFIQQLPI